MSDGTIGKNNYIEQFKVGLTKSGYSEDALKKLEDKDLAGIFAQLDEHDGKLDGKINLKSDDLFEAIKSTFAGTDPKKAEEDFNAAFESYTKTFNADDKAVSDRVQGEVEDDTPTNNDVPGLAPWKKATTREERLKLINDNWEKTAAEKDVDGKPYKSDPARKQAATNMYYKSARLEDGIKYENEGVEKGLEGNELAKYKYTKLLNDGLCYDEKEAEQYKKILENLENGDSGKMLTDAVNSLVNQLQDARAITPEQLQIAKDISSGKLETTGWASNSKHPFKKLDNATISKIQNAAALIKSGKESEVIVKNLDNVQTPNQANTPSQAQVPSDQANISQQPDVQSSTLADASNTPTPSADGQLQPTSSDPQTVVAGDNTSIDATIRNSALAKTNNKQQAAADYENLRTIIDEAKKMKKTEKDPTKKAEIDKQIKIYEEEREKARKAAGIHKKNFFDYALDFLFGGIIPVKGPALTVYNSASALYNTFFKKWG